MPSTPIRRPACSTSARSGASSSSMGLVLLMCVYTRCRLGSAPQPGQAAVGPRDRQVVHLPRGALADAEADQLVVGPERAVEQHQVGGRRGGASSASSRPPQPGTKAHVPPVRSSRTTSPTVWPGRSSRANRGGPAGTGKAGDPEPARRAVAVAEPERPVGHQLGRRSTSAKARVTGSSRESSSRTRRTASVAATCSRRASRRSTMPSVWSSSASVKTMPSTGTWRTPAGRGERRAGRAGRGRRARR